MGRPDKALACFQSGFCCTQAILHEYGDLVGLDRQLALKLGEPFVGGIVHRREVCGGVLGALMVIGMKYGRTDAKDKSARKQTIKASRRFIKKFESRNKTTACADLINRSTSEFGGEFLSAEGNRICKSCDKCVYDAAEILDEILT